MKLLSHLTKDFFGNRQSRAIAVAFIAVGLLFGTWGTFIPYIQEKFALNDADLGLILLSMPVGSVTMNLVGAWLVEKIGMKTTTILGMIGMALAFLIPINSSSVYLLPVGLYLCGSGISITNIAMNMSVTNIESDFDIKIMSTCHGMFSVGLMVGSMFASLSRGFDWNPGYYMFGFSSMIILFALLIRPTVYKIKDDTNSGIKSESKFILPRGTFLVMILIGVCGNLTEGIMADWSSVFMKNVVHSSPYFVGWGLAGYSLFMSLGRFFGDSLIPKLGANKILIYGGFMVAIGVSIAVLFPTTWLTIIGFSIVGAGVSCAAPILYGASARIPGVSKGTGLAVMNTFAMGGFMAGPVLIGFVSQATSLSWAFSLLILLALTWTFLSSKIKFF